MSNIVIRVDGLSKKYHIGGRQEGYRTLRDALTGALVSPFRRARRLLRGQAHGATELKETIWALKDVAFEIKQGEVVGIIGRNGAGKTTLLKILSRITEPTEGYAEIHGRVGSLLEVGTGFNPELTGRENIYLNGAILGMKKAEIERKFDEIVDFAEIERFIDTPVKHYSSGMYMRLAFAVAAHLEPEILLVDEVLAVGDAAFQKKCLGKMESVAQQGRTVLFVSHNMGAVMSLCTRALLFFDGIKLSDGSPTATIAEYMESFSDSSGSSYVCKDRSNGRAWIESMCLKSGENENSGTFLMSESINVECFLKIVRKSNLTLSVQIREMNNSPIYHFPNGDSSYAMPSSPGTYRLQIRLPSLHLYPGKYLLRLTLCEAAGAYFEHLHIVDNIRFEVQQDYSLCERQLSRNAGLVFSVAEWSAESKLP